MKKLRKITALLISAALLTFTFSACKKKGGEEGDFIYVTDEDGETVIGEDGEPIKEAPSAMTLTDDDGNIITQETVYSPVTTRSPFDVNYIKAGFIYASDPETDEQVECFEYARTELKRLGVSSCYVKNVKVSQFEDAVDALKNQGCNLIISTSARYHRAVSKVSKKDEEALLDGKEKYFYYINYAGNEVSGQISAMQPKTYQAANILGLLAAFNTDSQKIGVIADINMYNAKAVAGAFVLGTREISTQNFDVSLNWALSENETETKAAIDDHIAAGRDVIFVYQTSEFAIKYCEEKGVRVIGFSKDIKKLAPTTWLAGYSLNIAPYISEKTRSIQAGAFKSGFSNGELDGIILIDLNEPNLKQGSIKITETLKQTITDGRNFVFNGEIIDTDGKIRVAKGDFLSAKEVSEVEWLPEYYNYIKNFSPPLGYSPILSDLEVFGELLENADLPPATGNNDIGGAAGLNTAFLDESEPPETSDISEEYLSPPTETEDTTPQPVE